MANQHPTTKSRETGHARIIVLAFLMSALARVCGRRSRRCRRAAKRDEFAPLHFKILP
jgi:hypothetical protein